jgi:hypothetical protein
MQEREDRVYRLRGQVNNIADETKVLVEALLLMAPDDARRAYLEPRLAERKAACEVARKKYYKARDKFQDLIWAE